MKTPAHQDRFPFGAPCGSTHPYNSLADAVGAAGEPRPLWQQTHGFTPLAKVRALLGAVLRAGLDWKQRATMADRGIKTEHA